MKWCYIGYLFILISDYNTLPEMLTIYFLKNRYTKANIAGSLN